MSEMDCSANVTARTGDKKIKLKNMICTDRIRRYLYSLFGITVSNSIRDGAKIAASIALTPVSINTVFVDR
nr:hypothetical protein [Paenibacillus sp. LS1]